MSPVLQSSNPPILPYADFLAAKVTVAEDSGFEVEPWEINPRLKPFTADIVAASIRSGRRAIFAAFGLHKSVTQIENMRLLAIKAQARCLIVIPLGVRQEFFADAREFFQDEFAVRLIFIQSDADLSSACHPERSGAIAEGPPAIFITNYESIREGKLDISQFQAVSLDEADCLRSFGSKTFGEFLFGPMMEVKYRFVATATPSPNDFIELIAYGHFLGANDMGEIKTRFFKRDSEHADRLTLLEHKAADFWLWVQSWAIFLSAPSELGYSDEGYALPPLDVRWHEIPSDHRDAGEDKRGQGRLLKESRISSAGLAKEKRSSLPARIDKLMQLRAEDPDAHRLLWHDLEDERKLLEHAIPGLATVCGNQDDEPKEAAILGFRDGLIPELAAKPVMLGGGCNFQRHCSWQIFLGVGYKFRDFIQAIHRLQRFGQTQRVRVDIIYSEAERGVKEELVRKWKQHEELTAVMSQIIREHGLSSVAIRGALTRSMGCEPLEESTEYWTAWCNDTVLQTAELKTDSIHLITTSIPFSSQYEYTPSFNDFGNTDGAEHFWAQMDYTIPDWLRVLKPGRICAVHVKDRIQDGAMTGLKYPTVDPFHADCIQRFKAHGFTYIGMITVITDVVRENNQTYRLTMGEMVKDGSVKGVGMPEYIVLFRKKPSVQDNGYADEPVRKDPDDQYSLARWQLDAHALWRSSGNRYLEASDLRGSEVRDIYRAFRAHNLVNVYDYESHVRFGEGLAEFGRLRKDFMLIPPVSTNPDVWTDVMRARTLNAAQVAKGRVKHLCPLQIDIVDRLIKRYSMKGEIVYDPFAGIFTVPTRAVALGRIGKGTELNAGYWADGIGHLKAAEAKLQTATLFDMIHVEETDDADALEIAE